MPSSVRKTHHRPQHSSFSRSPSHLLGRPWQTWVLVSYFAAWFSYFVWFWSKALRLDEQGNLIAGHVNIWGDWAVHFTMGSSLAYRGLLLTQSPLLIGAKFSYPYLANAISAVLIQMGTPFYTAFIIPSFLCSCAFVLTLFYFFRTVTRSRGIAILASLIFLLNGGIGIFYFGRDVLQSSEPLATLLNPPHEYTRLDIEHIKWISVIDSMLIPQRAFALGFPMALLALALIYQVVFSKKTALNPRTVSKLLLAGLLLGILPMAHTHSFLAAGIILVFWLIGSFLMYHSKARRFWLTSWLIVGGVSMALALPIFYYFFFNQTQGFIDWFPGWLAREFHMNWLLFWFKNWFVMPWLGLVGWWMMLQNKKAVAKNFFTWAPFGLIFILANLFLFQPFSWDNTKLLAWSAVGFAGLAGWLFYYVGRKMIKSSRPKFVRGFVLIGSAALFFLTIASGTIDAYWITRIKSHSFQMYSADDLQLAEWVKKETPIDAVWLTGDHHNHWLFNLTGRQAVATYPGWLWTHGYDYHQTTVDAALMYLDPSRSDIYEKYGVKYVVVGPEERRKWMINESLSNKSANLKLIKSTPSTQIYEYVEN